MAKKSSPVSIAAVRADFDEVIRHLEGVRIVTSFEAASKLNLARRIHACTLSMISWSFRIEGIAINEAPFLEEIASDALQLLPHILLGYSKSSKLLLRSLIENTLRFVYFSDHPVEFKIMNAEQKWYMETTKLFEYIKIHPDFKKPERTFDAINKMTTLYDELSAGIHGRRVSDLIMKSALQDIRFDLAAGEAEYQILRRCTECVNFVLMIKLRIRFANMDIQSRRLLLRTLPLSARGAWNEPE